MSSANDEGDDELREGMAKSKARAQWGGAAVVFGLVIEVVLAAAYPKRAAVILSEEIWIYRPEEKQTADGYNQRDDAGDIALDVGRQLREYPWTN
jgi:hypothetical protein